MVTEKNRSPKSVNQNRSTKIGQPKSVTESVTLKKSVSEIGHEKHKIGHRLKDRPLLPQDGCESVRRPLNIGFPSVVILSGGRKCVRQHDN